MINTRTDSTGGGGCKAHGASFIELILFTERQIAASGIRQFSGYWGDSGGG